MLSRGGRTVRSHRFGERGSGVGGGAGSSGPSISLETKFASGKLQMSRLSSGHQEGGRVGCVSPATGSLGPWLSIDG